MENALAISKDEALLGDKADAGKRFIAALIDLALALLAGLIPFGNIVGAFFLLTRDGVDFEFMDRRSPGKKLLRLRPVTMDGERLQLEHSIKRNWMLAIAPAAEGLIYIPYIGWILIPALMAFMLLVLMMEVFFILTNREGRRWGDLLANTKVIEVED